MTYGVQLLDINGQLLGETRELLSVAAPFVRKLLGKDLPGVGMQLLMMPVMGYDNDLPGSPYLFYNTEGVSYAYVQLYFESRLIYRHPHTIGEILEAGLRAWLAGLPAPQSVAGYRLAGPNLSHLQGRSRPVVAGVTTVEPYAPGEKPAFRIRPIPPQKPPVRSLMEFGVDGWPRDGLAGESSGQVKVLLDPRVEEELNRTLPFSSEVEEGGFLIGRVYSDREEPGAYITRITAALPAHQSGASLWHFTFTGDSFDLFRRTLDQEYPGHKILGWYHTHLFPATSLFGLSTIDYRLHFTTFKLPWQLAGLLNLDGHERTLRFYTRKEDDMALCGHQPVRKEGEP